LLFYVVSLHWISTFSQEFW